MENGKERNDDGLELAYCWMLDGVSPFLPLSPFFLSLTLRFLASSSAAQYLAVGPSCGGLVSSLTGSLRGGRGGRKLVARAGLGIG